MQSWARSVVSRIQSAKGKIQLKATTVLLLSSAVIRQVGKAAMRCERSTATADARHPRSA